MGDWERKDPDEEFAWRDRKATVVQTLLDKLMEDDGIEHDAFLNCIILSPLLSQNTDTKIRLKCFFYKLAEFLLSVLFICHPLVVHYY